MSELRVAAVLTHPVQYYSPLFRELAARSALRVFYAHRPSPVEQGTGFGVPFEWDVDLTSGYDAVWLRNQAHAPDVSRFNGCDVPDVGEQLRAWRPDAILLFGWHSRVYLQALAAARMAGIPAIVRSDSQLRGTRSPARRALKRLGYPLLLRQFAACIAVGQRAEQYFRAYGARAVFRSPHFVDNEFFARRASGMRPSARAGWDLDPEAFVVLFAGKLIDMKRPLDVVAALARVRSRNVQFLVAGAGQLEDAMRQHAVASGVRVRFAGFLNQSEIPAAYAASDVLVLPSTGQETWGLVVNEAMACGRPAIVSSSVGCGPDLVENGLTGYVVPEGDIQALGDRIDAMVRDPRLASELGRSAAARVAAFNASTAADGVLAACEFVTRTRRRMSRVA